MLNKDEINQVWKADNRIRFFKKERGITSADIAEKIGREPNSVAKMINSEVSITLYQVVQISEVLGCQPADLLPKQWQSKIEDNENINKIKKIFEEIIDTLEYWLMVNRRILEHNHKASLTIALFDAIKDLPAEKYKDKIYEYIQFYINTKTG